MPGESTYKRVARIAVVVLTGAAIAAVVLGASLTRAPRGVQLSAAVSTADPAAPVGDEALPEPAPAAVDVSTPSTPSTSTPSAPSTPGSDSGGDPPAVDPPAVAPPAPPEESQPAPAVEPVVAAAGRSVPELAAPSPECALALAAVEARGLLLPEGTEFRCPGSAESVPGGRQHSGVACWGKQPFCPGRSYIAVNPEATGSGDGHLEYVVAHEVCHIQAYLRGERGGTEPAADACAALAGFPRPLGRGSR